MPPEAAASEAAPPAGGTEWKQDTEAAAIRSGDKVFFAGDSLMQGVAPFVQKSLKQQYGIESANLSKQSTGLSYPSFFDWPKTIEETLKKHPKSAYSPSSSARTTRGISPSANATSNSLPTNGRKNT